MPRGYTEVLEEYLRQLMDDYYRTSLRKKEITSQMVKILGQLREDDPLISPPTPSVISEKNVARLLAETGPLSDFDNWRKLMRYAGLSILGPDKAAPFRGITRSVKR